MTIQTIDFSDPELYVDWITEFTDALYNPEVRYIFLKWWSGAGKSYATAQIMMQNVLDNVRIACFRKVATTLRASVFQLMKDIYSNWNLEPYIDIRETNKELKAKDGNGFCMMFWLDDPEKIKSLANFDWFWIEEATELTYDDFTQLDLRLRWGKNHKIICTFNPISSRHWLKTTVHDSNWKEARWILKTARDNRFVDERYLDNLNNLKERNEAWYKIYALNEWGEAVEWLVYQQYNTFTQDIDPEVIGLDFWRNDPTSLVYLKREDGEWKKKKLYAQEKIYQRELTATQLVEKMELIGVPKHILIIADSARPEMISVIKNSWYNIIGVEKYAWSVKDQIANVQEYDLRVNWTNITREVAWYSRKKDKNWNSLEVPEDWDDHTLDWTRYWCTHFAKPASISLVFW